MNNNKTINNYKIFTSHNKIMHQSSFHKKTNLLYSDAR